MKDSQQIQLQIIRQVTTLLQGAAIPHWLFGGWAIDFRLGEITRIHDDIEFFIWQKDAPQIISFLAQHQYEPYSGG
jgi:phosphorylcholine metabolism protein LicD